MPALIGTAANQVPVNGMLGRLAFQNPDTFVFEPPATVNPARVGSMVFQLTSNTILTVKVMGSDGVIRSAALTLA